MPAIQRVDAVGFTAAIIERLAAARQQVSTEARIVREATARMETAKEAVSVAFRELHEELGRMDLVHSGNYGWEQRIAQFLVDLRGELTT